ncbi:hypothetical protein [Alicyclobacillus sp. SO9]|uniref:hypothetical protein n=1 Tax=Alicyclobacillus sp. SO9 TaxID=2665646 RepID=UPI0018E8F277|nr:hypothetical protein [Alicyclobacillus sp. SO9]QQE80291.1 hypothetical protein GI364_07660 [Alicyclobacillus sp. SO9]
MSEPDQTEQWSVSHLAVTDLMTQLLGLLRDKGYNPSNHISYDRRNHHLLLDQQVTAGNPDIRSMYNAYLEACRKRDEELEQVKQMPKTDLGF